MFYDGVLYDNFKDENKEYHLMGYDPLGGEVVFDLKTERTIGVKWICGGYLAYSTLNKDFGGDTDSLSFPDNSGARTWYYLDAKTGETRDMPLFLQYATPRPINANFEDSPTFDGQSALLCGTWQDNLILSSGYYAVAYYDTEMQEDLIFYKETYSLIPQDDYWAGTENLSDIKPFKLNTTADIEPKVNADQQRLFAFGAVLAQRNGFGFNSPGVISPYARQTLVDRYAQTMEQAWGITDEKSAIKQLEWLKNEGHRTTTSQSVGFNDYYSYLINYDTLSGAEQALVADAKVWFDGIMAELLEHHYTTEPTFTAEELASVQSLSAWDYDRLVTVARWCYSLGYISEADMYAYAEFAAREAVKEYDDWRQYFVAVIIGRTLWSGTDYIAGDDSNLINVLLERKDSIYNQVPFK